MVDRIRVIRMWIRDLKPELREALEMEQTAPFYVARAIVDELQSMDMLRISNLTLDYVREINENGPLGNPLPESDLGEEVNGLVSINLLYFFG